MDRILITGFTGYIGRNLVSFLKSKYELYGLTTRKNQIFENIKEENVLAYSGANGEIEDFCISHEIDTIIHLAAFHKSNHSKDNIDKYISANIELGTHCLEALRGDTPPGDNMESRKRFICVGTNWQHYNQEDYNAVNLYAATKEAFDKIVDFYCDAYGIKAITLELYETYGPFDNRNKLLNLLKKNRIGDALGMTLGYTILDMVYIDDVVQGFDRAVNILRSQKSGTHEKYALSSREYYTIREIMSIFEEVYGKKLDVRLGEIAYTKREMMEPYKECKLLPGWEISYSLREGLQTMKTVEEKKEKSVCRFCGHKLETTCVDLGLSPLSNEYISRDELSEGQHYYPLTVKTCSNCFLTQTTANTSPMSIFHNYQYFSSYSSSWVDHAKQYADMIVERQKLSSDSLIAEAASNDGYLLQFFLQKEIPCYGIEPAENVAEHAEKMGLHIYKNFFGKELAERLKSEKKSVDLFIGNNVLAHVPDINSFLEGINILLKENGIATIEFPHLLNLLKNKEFDTIYHEHFSYLSLLFLDKATKAHGLRLYDVEKLSTHGGSLRVYICKAYANYKERESVSNIISEEKAFGLDDMRTYSDFHRTVINMKRDIWAHLLQIVGDNEKVAAYGAAAKGNTLLNYCGIGRDIIDYVVDANPHKQGLFLPGTQIPIVDIEYLEKNCPDYLIIIPWNIKDEIIASLKAKKLPCKYITLIPEFEVFE